jgi:hypothetical protein
MNNNRDPYSGVGTGIMGGVISIFLFFLIVSMF